MKVVDAICEIRKREGVEFLNCHPTNPLIDAVLAGHYGFMAEDLDFILNYDIKYRLGRNAGEEEE